MDKGGQATIDPIFMMVYELGPGEWQAALISAQAARSSDAISAYSEMQIDRIKWLGKSGMIWI